MITLKVEKSRASPSLSLESDFLKKPKEGGEGGSVLTMKEEIRSL